MDLTLLDYGVQPGSRLYLYPPSTDITVSQGGKIGTGSHVVRILSNEPGTPVVEGTTITGLAHNKRLTRLRYW